jgi:hypothetical protein
MLSIRHCIKAVVLMIGIQRSLSYIPQFPMEANHATLCPSCCSQLGCNLTSCSFSHSMRQIVRQPGSARPAAVYAIQLYVNPRRMFVLALRICSCTRSMFTICHTPSRMDMSLRSTAG